MKKIQAACIIFAIGVFSKNLCAQEYIPATPVPDSIAASPKVIHEKDILDVYRDIFKKKRARQKKEHKLLVSLFPAAGTSPATGLAAVVAANLSFYAHQQNTNISAFNVSISYTSRNQFIFPIRSTLWTKDNKWNFIGDWRYVVYNQETYGLGGNTKITDEQSIDYKFIRFYQHGLRKTISHLYLGGGVNYDHLTNIRQHLREGQASHLTAYGATETSPSSSFGLSTNIVWDDRKNSTTPEKGSYANLIYRFNLAQAGWQMMYLDLRKYMRLRKKSENLLCFWFFTWAVTSGDAPYFLLPSNGWDTYTNSGRGYVQGRFRAQKMLYFESEYRYAITRNGLLGGVVFANASSFSEPGKEDFRTIHPAIGSGLRIRLNKASRTNLNIDFGLGLKGAYGIYFDVGEVF